MKHSLFHPVAAALIALSCVGVSFGQGASVSQAETPRLTINAYSGMPNPSVELVPAEVAATLELVAKASPETSPAYKSVAPSLRGGYAGMILGPLPGPTKESHVILTVYRSGIELRTFYPAERRSTTETKVDAGAGVEKHLARLAEAKGIIRPALKQRIDAPADHREKAK